MACGTSCVKYLMFIFNFVFALAGIALVVVGALKLAEVNEVNSFVDSRFQASPIALIVLGSIIFIISFYGCCGAIRESTCMITTFAIFLMVILVIEIAIAVVAFVYRDAFDDGMKSAMNISFIEFRDHHNRSSEFDAMQSALDCCGLDGPKDYTPDFFPSSCCKTNVTHCNPNDEITTFQVGCFTAMQNLITAAGLLLGIIAIVVAAIMIIGIVFGLCLASSLRNDIRRGRA